MDSLDWSKKYDVLSISRLFLRDAVKFPTQQVNELTDEDMQRIADMVEPVRIFSPCKSGGTGGLGREVVRKLITTGYTVRLMS